MRTREHNHTQVGYSMPLFELPADLRAYLSSIDPDVEKYHDVVRGDWSMDEIIVFAYLTAINDYNRMLTRFIDDNGTNRRILNQLTRTIRAAIGSRFTISKD